MSLNGSFLTEEQFTCSICLDVFTNPSSIPCGHTFCMACITRYWDGSQVCQCPLCKKTFQKRPDIQINRTLREITDQFKSITKNEAAKTSGQRRCSSDRHNSIPGVWIESTRLRKTVSCLCCKTCFCKTDEHHFPHMMSYSNSRRRFTLSGAASSKNIPLCEIHNRGILLYCKSDQVCICPECEIEDHNDHDTVTVEAEWMETKMLLRDSEQDIQDMISERRRKMEQIRESVTELEMAVERETSGTVCLFSALASAIERSQAELIEVMDNSRRSAEHQADAMIHQLEKEIEELQRREAALAELAQSEDHVHCVKTFPSLSTPPVTKNWTGVSLNTDLGTAAIYRSLAATVEKFQRDLRNILEHGERKMQDFALNVTLDSNTAHPRLVLSEDLKSVWCGDRHHHVPDTPERFDRVVCVLGREAISHGKHYWEVEVNGKTDWDLGVARQSVNRKGKIDYTPNNGFWFLSLRDKHKYAFRSEPCTDVEMNLRPHKIGIFVDYEKGEVSFYNVDAKVHIYTFHDIFTENLFPFFSPCTNKSGKNEMPLIITPVQME
uniref:Tripartite motif-containing protein 7-like n=1 Tax=Poecilia formosa TaxID=48698 RepID=A0A096MBK0_POEFO